MDADVACFVEGFGGDESCGGDAVGDGHDDLVCEEGVAVCEVDAVAGVSVGVLGWLGFVQTVG